MEMVKCQYCGEEFSTRGIKTHERNCPKNPENKDKLVVNSSKKEEYKEDEVITVKAKEGEIEVQEDGGVKIISTDLENKILTQLNEEVSIVKTEDKKPYEPPKNVKIKLRKYHRCHIGGHWYEFFPDKQYIVPENVKEILMRADLLKPI